MKKIFLRNFFGNSRTALTVALVILLVVYSAYFLIGAGTELRDVYATVFKGDTKSYRFTVHNAYTYGAVDLTGHIVKFRVKKNSSDSSYVIDKTCTISDAENGQATVSLSATDTDIDTGTYYAYVVMTNAGGTSYETLQKSKWVVAQ
jgi:hypothetical protein